MAQTPSQKQPLRNQQSLQEEFDQLSASTDVPVQPQVKQETLPASKKILPTKKAVDAKPEGDRIVRSIHRVSKTLFAHPVEAKESSNKLAPINAQQTQLGKLFKTKCQTELKALLEAIRPDFHQEIKNLYHDELHADLYLKVGSEQLTKPFHKCLIASRAFKFYCALKAFKRGLDNSKDKDIYVYEFQDQLFSPVKERPNTENETGVAELAKEKAKEEKLREALEVVSCELPENFISPELLIHFLRSTYFDQDLLDEEARLRELAINWFKINKPELIRPSKIVHKRPNDYRESFRTIQPDFEQLSIASGNMSANEQSSSDMAKSSGQTDVESNLDEPGDLSQADSQMTSLLMRTETFELLSKSNPDSPVVDLASESVRADESRDEDDGDRSIVSGSVNESESSEVYTPVTRTGLKPKQFNTPVGLKPKKTPTTTPRKAEPETEAAKTKTPVPMARSGSVRKQQPTTTPTAKTPSQSAAAASGTPKAPSSLRSRAKVEPAKPKQTVIARAHPISLERSQLPGTSLSKGPTKNFIAANKKLISHMERKVASSSPSGDQNSNLNDDSENDVSDASLLSLTESLTTDTLAAQVDKFSLISQSKLAEALSRLFIQEIMTDTVVLTQHNKQISAHRCILAARSAYLSDLISKQCLPSMTPESSSAASRQLIKLDLTEHSYPVVYFALMHIYSGIVKVPEDIELEDLTKLSHELHVGTLRQVCMHNLRMNYCHYFHKPCNVCCIGVLRTLPLAWRYDLTELYSKCLTWIGSHFAQIFCLEEFANLKPNDLIEECYKETLTQLTPDNVIQRTIECQKLLKSLPRVKWTEAIICLVGRQLEDFCHYVADNYEKILQSESFLNLGKSCWECEVLEENLLAAMNHLKPDSGCKTLIQLDKIECSIESYLNEPRNVSDTFANLVSKMRKYCERYLLKEAAAVVHCSSWRQMNPSLQKRIKDQALLSTDFDEPTKHLASKPKLPSMARHQQQQPRSTPSPQPNNSGSDTRSPSNRSTPDSRLRSPNTTYLPPPKNKPAAARHVKVLK